jgi:hypothetical protein
MANRSCWRDIAVCWILPFACHDVIHSVNNPLDRITAALHVYGGDLLAAPRSMWDSETLMEGPIDLARDIRAIDAYNGTLQTGGLSYSVPARGPQSGQRQSP